MLAPPSVLTVPLTDLMLGSPPLTSVRQPAPGFGAQDLAAAAAAPVAAAPVAAALVAAAPAAVALLVQVEVASEQKVLGTAGASSSMLAVH